MKKCTNCGCINRDTRAMCADCGRTLVGAEHIDKSELDAKLEKLSRYSPFSFKPRHQIVFYASLLLLAAIIVLNILSLMQPEMVFIAVLCCIISILFTRFAEAMWNMEKFFLRFNIRFRINGDIEPSDWWFISREIVIFAFFIGSILTFLFGFTAVPQI